MRFLSNIIKFITTNFGPLVGFYIVNQIWGFKLAVFTSIGLVIAEYFLLKYKKQKISSFFYFSSLIVIIFGIADLIIQEPVFFKFEASLTNLFSAAFFGISLFKDKSIIQEFAEAKKRTSMIQNDDKRFFFRFLTIIWCVYFLIKAILYFWISFNSNLNDSFISRMIIGKISFWIMLFVSIGMPRQIWKALEKLKLFPSQKSSFVTGA